MVSRAHGKNKKMLQHVPHIKYLDFAIVFQLYVGPDLPEYGTITITDALFNSWGADMEELIRVALKNTPEILPFSLINMAEFISDKCPNMPRRLRKWVILKICRYIY